MKLNLTKKECNYVMLLLIAHTHLHEYQLSESTLNELNAIIDKLDTVI